uniref:Uncharacterized protein n=1 Tax=Arundo donax TaxID=35708 RepID=A0A0A8Y9A1_ARUDO
MPTAPGRHAAMPSPPAGRPPCPENVLAQRGRIVRLRGWRVTPRPARQLNQRRFMRRQRRTCCFGPVRGRRLVCTAFKLEKWKLYMGITLVKKQNRLRQS